MVKPVAEMKKKIAEELRKSNPPVSAAPVREPPVLEKSSPAVAAAPKPKPPPTPPPREKSSPAVSPPPSKPKMKAVLSSEGDDWSSYLEDLASKQGKIYDTGFKTLDREFNGLAPGLMLLVDEDRERMVSFLKQVTDQMAASGSIRCLFLASEQPKAALGSARSRGSPRSRSSTSKGAAEEGLSPNGSESSAPVEAPPSGSSESSSTSSRTSSRWPSSAS